jgi:hypothetical protein
MDVAYKYWNLWYNSGTYFNLWSSTYENLHILGRYDRIVGKLITILSSGCLIFIKTANFSTQLNIMQKSKSSLSFKTIAIINDLFYGSTALLGLRRFFCSLSIHSWYDSFDGGSARRKAATYTQNNTNTE